MSSTSAPIIEPSRLLPEAQLELLMRLEQVVISTVLEQVDDRDAAAKLSVELLAGMERVARIGVR